MDLTVCIATFGDDSWKRLAMRAIRSATAERVAVIHVHGETLHDARNQALARVTTEWVVTLDADDEIEPGYVAALERGRADLRAPAVRYVTPSRPNGRARLPRVAGHHHQCVGDCLPDGNWLVVGTAVRASMLRAVGGWRDEPIYEDWSVWLRCWAAGASVEAIPDAVYRAHARPDSRNRAPSMQFKNEWHRRIAASVLTDLRSAA